MSLSPQVLLDWVNDVLVEERIIVKQLEEDLYDGQVLQKLLGECQPWPGVVSPKTPAVCVGGTSRCRLRSPQLGLGPVSAYMLAFLPGLKHTSSVPAWHVLPLSCIPVQAHGRMSLIPCPTWGCMSHLLFCWLPVLCDRTGWGSTLRSSRVLDPTQSPRAWDSAPLTAQQEDCPPTLALCPSAGD